MSPLFLYLSSAYGYAIYSINIKYNTIQKALIAPFPKGSERLQDKTLKLQLKLQNVSVT